MDKGKKTRAILKGFRNTFFLAISVALLISIIVLVYSIFSSINILKGIFTVFYYFGAFILMFSIPLLYKRNESPNLRRIRSQSILHGFMAIFRNPYADKAMLDSFEEFKGEGFWVGIFVIFFSIILFALAVMLENIYYHIGG